MLFTYQRNREKLLQFGGRDLDCYLEGWIKIRKGMGKEPSPNMISK